MKASDGVVAFLSQLAGTAPLAIQPDGSLAQWLPFAKNNMRKGQSPSGDLIP